MTRFHNILLFSILLIGPCLSYELPGQWQTWEQAEGKMQCAVQNTSFQGGEHVEFKVYYNWGFVWIPAGKVTFDVEEMQDAYRITATGRSFASYEWFFKVRDYYETIIDKHTMLPRSFIRKVNEGDYHVEEHITYNQDGQTVLSSFINNKGVKTDKNFDIDGCVQDLLSVIYRLRNADVSLLRRQGELPFRLFIEDGTYDLKVLYRRQEVRNLYQLGRYNTLRITPQLLSGNVFKEGDEMYVNVTDDANRLPVYIESPVSVGAVKVYLTKYQNLRHPLTSKVE